MDLKKSEDSKLVIKQGEDPFIYSYRTLTQMKAREDYNFYAIIIDASFPKKDESYFPLSRQEEPLSKYYVILKLLDQGINFINNPNNLSENIVTLIIQANEIENIPYIHQIGDIIRVRGGKFIPKNRNVYSKIYNYFISLFFGYKGKIKFSRQDKFQHKKKEKTNYA